jgi:nucleotide-binding universal stress UspA family protein
MTNFGIEVSYIEAVDRQAAVSGSRNQSGDAGGFVGQTRTPGQGASVDHGVSIAVGVCRTRDSEIADIADSRTRVPFASIEELSNREAAMFTKVMVPLDTSALAEQALLTAGAIARAAHAELRLVMVHQPVAHAGYPDAPWNGARTSMEDAYLEGKSLELENKFGVRVIPEQATGPVAPTLCRLANERHVDLIVMTTHGRTGLNRAWLGSVADTLVRSLRVPVLMLRPTERPSTEPTVFRRIMIPLDGSARAECIIDAALALGGTSATYILARVVSPVPVVVATVDGYGMVPTVVDPIATDVAVEEAEQYMNAVSARLAARGATSVEQAISASESAAPTLLGMAKAHRADLIALGSHGRGGARFVLGSVADKLLRGGTVPLLVCRDVRSDS